MEPLSTRLRAREFPLGSWVTFIDRTIRELLYESGCDFLVLDSEHSPFGPETLLLSTTRSC